MVTMESAYALFDELSDGVCLADADGNVLYMNPAAKRLLRPHGPAAGLVNACQDLCGRLETGPGCRASEHCSLRRPSPDVSVTFKGKHGPHSSFNWKGDRIVRAEAWKDLRVRCLRARLPAHEGLPEETHLVLIEDSSAEAELLRHKSDWRAMVAHDLRAPLTSIYSGLKLLQEGNDPKVLALSVRGCERMMELLDLYLDVSRLDAQAMPVKVEALELAPLAHEAAAQQESLAAARGVTLTVDVPSGLRAMGDQDLLPRVLSNLVNNGIKYNKHGGSVAVRARAADGLVSLAVADTGLGIAAGDLPRIFDRYYQAEARRAGRTKGNGLGLAFCKEAVRLMGGAIEARSEPGKGTEFSVTLAAAGAPR